MKGKGILEERHLISGESTGVQLEYYKERCADLDKELKIMRRLLDGAESKLVQIYQTDDESRRKMVIEIDYCDLDGPDHMAEIIVDRITQMTKNREA